MLTSEAAKTEGAARWLVLLAFSFNAACNAFMFMDFSTTAALSISVLDTDEDGLEWLYSVSLLTVMPLSVPAAFLLVRYNWWTSLAGVLFDVVGAWLRYIAISRADYFLALSSSILIGFAAAIIIVSYTMIAELWFPVEERALATSFGVQSNYLGWALGSLIPLFVHDVDTQRIFFLWQAIGVSMALVLFAAFYRKKQHRSSHSNARAGDFIHQLQLLGGNRVYWVHCACYAMLGGVSFTVPAVLDIIVGRSCELEGLGMSTNQTLWLNFCFVACGIVTGMALGVRATPQRSAAILRFLFIFAAICLASLSSVATIAASIDSALLYKILLLLMCLSGGATLGFIGIGLRAAVEVAHPVSESLSGGMVEFWLQGCSVLLTQFTGCSTGFALLAGAASVSAGVLLFTPFASTSSSKSSSAISVQA